MARHGGGPAFPTQQPGSGGPQGSVDVIDGLSLRDYFAVHGDVPTHAEIVASANGNATYDGSTDSVTFGQVPQTVSFAVWWAGISPLRRARSLADVRYLHADAMLLVRDL